MLNTLPLSLRTLSQKVPNTLKAHHPHAIMRKISHKQRERSLDEMYATLEVMISSAYAKARKQGKHFLLLLGESHTCVDSYSVNVMVQDICFNQGIYHCGVELSPEEVMQLNRPVASMPEEYRDEQAGVDGSFLLQRYIATMRCVLKLENNMLLQAPSQLAIVYARTMRLQLFGFDTAREHADEEIREYHMIARLKKITRPAMAVIGSAHLPRLVQHLQDDRNIHLLAINIDNTLLNTAVMSWLTDREKAELDQKQAKLEQRLNALRIPIVVVQGETPGQLSSAVKQTFRVIARAWRGQGLLTSREYIYVKRCVSILHTKGKKLTFIP